MTPLRPVTVSEVAEHASGKCRHCQSSGVLTTWARVHREPSKLPQDAAPVRGPARVETFTDGGKPAPLTQPCPCALSGFLEVHGHEAARDDQGRWWWVASEPVAPVSP